MKHLRYLALLLLLISSHAFAAITLADSNCATTTNVVADSSASVGDLIIATVQDYPVTTVTLSDSESGSYTLLTGFQIGAPIQIGVGYVRVTVAGTPTITGDANTGRICFMRFTGFMGTATVVGTAIASATGNSTAFDSGSGNTTIANEYLFGTYSTYGTSCSLCGAAGSPVGWTQEQNSGNYVALSYNVGSPVSSGTAAEMTGTLGSSDYWGAMIYGFYDNTGASCTHAGVTSAGAIATPNGSSGSYQGKSGAFVTPDCSAIEYRQPAVGNFGVN